MDNIKWFKEAKYGMFIHFGLYSMLEGSYKGKRSSNYAEWIESYLEIPNAEMEKLAKAFNPIYFDAEEWVKFAKSCGMQYIVITSKHHEGFALFKSDVDPFNVVDATPFKRDIIGELAEACRKYGLKLGLYYSQDLDWHEKNGGGYNSNHISCSGVSWNNTWDFGKDAGDKDYSICFKNKILPQVKEILTKYGDICLIWFDVPMTINKEQSEILYNTVKELQPSCLVNSRLGNGMYDFVSLGDNEIPDKMPEVTNENIDYNDIDAFKPSPYGLYETACTLQDTWGFSYLDTNWKKPIDIYNNKKKLNSLGINYTINIGPDHLGRLPVQAMEILEKVAEMEKNND
jgi:alpha-L-fucosidase